MGKALGQDQETISPLLPGRQYAGASKYCPPGRREQYIRWYRGLRPSVTQSKALQAFCPSGRARPGSSLVTPPLPLPLDGRGARMQIYKHLVYFSNMSRGLFKMLVWTFQNARVNFANFSCGFCKLLEWIFPASLMSFLVLLCAFVKNAKFTSFFCIFSQNNSLFILFLRKRALKVKKSVKKFWGNLKKRLYLLGNYA